MLAPPSGPLGHAGMTAVVQPQQLAGEEVRREAGEHRDDRRPDEKGGEARGEPGTAAERPPEVVVEDALPLQGRHPDGRITEQGPSEPVAHRVDGRQRPGISREGADDRVELVQPEDPREHHGENEVKADEGREAHADAERERRCDPLRPVHAAHQLEQEAQATPLEGPAAPPLRRVARERPVAAHRRVPARWSWPNSETSVRVRPSASTAPEPSSTRPTRVTGTSKPEARVSSRATAPGGTVKSSS